MHTASIDEWTDTDLSGDSNAEQSGSADSKDSDEYGTPEWLIRRLTNAQGRLFSLDPAAGAETIEIARKRYTKEDNGLRQSWTGRDVISIFLNPPYSDPEPFLQRLVAAVDPADPEKADYAISITRADPSTGWWEDNIESEQSHVICYPERRLRFEGGGNKPDFSNAITVYGNPPVAIIEELADIGSLHTPTGTDDLLGDTEAAADTDDSGDSSDANSGETDADPTNLSTVGPHDSIELTLDDRRSPDAVELTVLPDGRKVDTETGEIRIDTIGETADGDQVCATLRNDPEIATNLAVEIAVDTDRWISATPANINVA